MDQRDELYVLAAAGHLVAPLVLAVGLATFGGWCSSRASHVASSFWATTLRFVLGLMGLGGDGYLVAAPLSLSDSSGAGIGAVESGLAVLSWACLLCGTAWAAGRCPARGAILLWCGVELVCSTPLCALLISEFSSQPQTYGKRCYIVLLPITCKFFIALSAGIFKDKHGSGEGGSATHDSIDDEEGKVTDENLHELSNPLSQLLL